MGGGGTTEVGGINEPDILGSGGVNGRGDLGSIMGSTSGLMEGTDDDVEEAGGMAKPREEGVEDCLWKGWWSAWCGCGID